MRYSKQTVVELKKDEAECLSKAYYIIHKINKEMGIFDIIDCDGEVIDKVDMRTTEFVSYMMHNLLIGGNTEIKINLLD